MAEGGEGEITFADDLEIKTAVSRQGRQARKGKRNRVGCQFRPAEDDVQPGQLLAEKGEEFGDAGRVPDVDAEGKDAGIAGGDIGGDIGGGLLEGELGERCLRPQVAHVGQQVPRAERGVAVAGVDGGDENGGFNIQYSIANNQCSRGGRPVGGKGTGDIKGLSRDGMGTDEAGGVEPVAGIGWWLVVDGWG